MTTSTRPNSILTLDRLRLALSRNRSAAQRSGVEERSFALRQTLMDDPGMQRVLFMR